MKANRVDFILDDKREAQRGDYEIALGSDGAPEFIFVCCPGCGSVFPLPLRPGAKDSWAWDGNRDAPTLTPSINHVGCWHGFLSEGEFKAC